MKKNYNQPIVEAVTISAQMIMSGSVAVEMGNGGSTNTIPDTQIISQ